MSKRWNAVFYILLTAELIICFIIACSGQSSSIGPSGENPVEALVTETIGTEGGTVEADGFLLTVPQGAFDDVNELSVYKDTTHTAFKVSGVAGPFQIEGLPDTFNKTLRLALAYRGTLSDESYIATGALVIDDVTGDSAFVYQTISAEDSSNHLVCMLEPRTGQNGSTKATSRLQMWTPWKMIQFEGLSGVKSLESEHFKFKYASYVHGNMGALINIMESQVRIILDDLTLFIDGIYRDWDWPVSVMVLEMEDIDFVITLDNMVKRQEHTINIDRILIESEDRFYALKMQTGDVLLKMILDDYLKNGNQSDSEKYWFKQAVASWAEELFLGEDYSGYPKAHRLFEMEPFNGMVHGERAHYAHGVGMSAVVKYLMDDVRFGYAGLVGTFENIWNGDLVIYALMNNVRALAGDWWPDFFAKYISGNIYDVSASEFMNENNVEDLWEIKDETTITHTFKSSEFGLYPDLSAKLFRIWVSYTELEDNMNLSLQAVGNVNSDGLAVLVFSMYNGILTLLNTPGFYSSGYVIQDLKDKVDSSMDHYLICVVNYNLYPPYNNTHDIDLQCTLTEEPEGPGYIECGLQIDVAAHYFNWTPDNSYDSYADDATISTYMTYQGSMNGNIFSATGTYNQYNYMVNGDMTLTFSSDFKTITHLEWNESGTHSTSNFTKSSTLVAENIPFHYGYYGTDIFEIEGEDICDHVITLAHSQSSADGLSYNLVDYSCTWDSQIFIALDYIDDGLKQQTK